MNVDFYVIFNSPFKNLIENRFFTHTAHPLPLLLIRHLHFPLSQIHTFSISLEKSRPPRKQNQTGPNRIQYAKSKVLILRLDKATWWEENSLNNSQNSERNTCFHWQESHKIFKIIIIAYISCLDPCRSLDLCFSLCEPIKVLLSLFSRPCFLGVFHPL